MRFVMACLWVLLLATPGCDKKPSGGAQPGPVSKAGGSSDEPGEKPAADAKKWDPSAGTAEVKGAVKFSGTSPKRRKVDMGGTPECSKLHGDAPPVEETVLINGNGTLKNVFVHVRKGLERWTFDTPGEERPLEQKGCTYVPHVLGIQVGQPLRITNGDALAHNVHGIPGQNPDFNFSQTQQGNSNTMKFDYPEMKRIKCDIHGWMNAYVCIVRHPFYAVTGDDGSFSLPKLPPGEYVIEAWHEKFGKKTLTVTVGDKETKEIEFVYDGK